MAWRRPRRESRAQRAGTQETSVFATTIDPSLPDLHATENSRGLSEDGDAFEATDPLLHLYTKVFRPSTPGLFKTIVLGIPSGIKSTGHEIVDDPGSTRRNLLPSFVTFKEKATTEA